MSEVRVVEGETFEGLLKRFNKRVQRDGALSEIRRRQAFESPTVRRKKNQPPSAVRAGAPPPPSNATCVPKL